MRVKAGNCVSARAALLRWVSNLTEDLMAASSMAAMPHAARSQIAELLVVRSCLRSQEGHIGVEVAAFARAAHVAADLQGKAN